MTYGGGRDTVNERIEGALDTDLWAGGDSVGGGHNR